MRQQPHSDCAKSRYRTAMRIFKRKTTMIEQLEADLASSRNRAEVLSEKRSAAQAELAKANAARLEHALEGDIADERHAAELQAEFDSCTSKLSGWEVALTAQQKRVADAEAKLTAERAAVERAQVAEKVTRRVAVINEALPTFLQAGRALADALMHVGDWHFESQQMSDYVRNAVGQVEAAGAFVAQELLFTADRIKSGDAPIPRERAPASASVPEPKLPLARLFAMRDIKFIDPETGFQRVVRRFSDVDLPPDLAERALKLNVGAEVTDPRRRKLLNSWPKHPDPRQCFDLDAADAVSTRDPVTVSDSIEFEPIDRGPGFVNNQSRGRY
ncbi:hypothetical protein [Bradyrhizobium genosp. P]|uniref:hypothetical protein n=1 Tax=Bradyrhizobium genosp. P TaxID=83641 RepID=UPI003CEF0B0B